MVQLRKKSTALDKYIFMHTIQDSDETLFYAMLVCHTRETMPFVYTPTVGMNMVCKIRTYTSAMLFDLTPSLHSLLYACYAGQACQEWSHIYRHTPRGLYLSLLDKGRIRDTLDHYPNQNIKVLCLMYYIQSYIYTCMHA